jgi:hypothetical protein
MHTLRYAPSCISRVSQTLLGALFVAFLGVVMSGKTTTFFLNVLCALLRPDLLLLLSRSNLRSLRRIWERAGAYQLSQGQLSSRDVMIELIRVSWKGVKKKTLDWQTSGIEILLVGNWRLHYTKRREKRNASGH